LKGKEDTNKVTDYQFPKNTYLDSHFCKKMERSCKVCPQVFTVLTVPVFIILYVFTAIVVVLILLFAQVKMKKVVKALIRFWARTSFAIMLKRLRIDGKEHIEKDQRYILVANHASLFDIMAIMAFYPDVSFFGKEYLTKIPIFGRVLKSIDYVPMRTTDLRNTKEMLEQLKEKSQHLTVAIFPEGTRTRDGELNRFRKGFIHLVRATGYHILPVTLKGFFFFKPANRFHINFLTRIGVTIHEPIEGAVLATKEDGEIIEHVRGVIQSTYS
jgi:1-acyl-sn-glycerol-3-phosphate acyltransferase